MPLVVEAGRDIIFLRADCHDTDDDDAVLRDTQYYRRHSPFLSLSPV